MQDDHATADVLALGSAEEKKGSPLKGAIVECYISAEIELWEPQTQLEGNSAPHPREPAVNQDPGLEPTEYGPGQLR